MKVKRKVPGFLLSWRGRRCNFLAVLLAFLLLIPVAGGCSCGVKEVIDQVSLTARGLQILNLIKEKAGEGYDVRSPRAKWIEALDSYSKGDYLRTSALLDKIETEIPSLKKVGERIFFKSTGDITVSALVFKPQGKGPWPAVAVNHPGFGEAADFSDVGIVFAEKGYLALVSDYRGSGKSEGRHELAKGEVDDVIFGLKYLESKGWIDDERIAATGQSHGATVSILAAAKYKKIKCVVAEAGFSDAVEGYKHISTSDDPASKEMFAKVKEIIPGGPDQYPEEYAVRSAINYVKDINAPVLLIHGAKDPLVPVDQSTKLYEALKAAGKTVELKIYPDEGHCVNNPLGRAEIWNMTLEWFRKYGV